MSFIRILEKEEVTGPLKADYDERTSVFGWNFVVYSIGAALLGVFVLYVIFPSVEGVENGLLIGDRYPLLVMIGGVFVTSVVLFCTFMTADQIPYMHDTKTVGERTKEYVGSFFKDTVGNLWALARNPSYISVCACLVGSPKTGRYGRW